MGKQEKILQILPPKVKVKITVGQSGCFLASLPEYEIFTEADDVFGLLENVNDLLFTFFDIPKKYRKQIFYFPTKTLKPSSQRVNFPFEVFVSSEHFHKYCPN